MRTLIAFLLLGFPCWMGAQQTDLPPTLSTDPKADAGTAGINAGTSFWGSPSGIKKYAVTGDDTTDTLRPGVADKHLGLTWTTTAPASLDNAVQHLNSTGGTVRVIFVGESAGWLDSFGYTYSGNPAKGQQSYTAWKEIQTTGSLANISFGDYFDVALAPGQMSSFDLWYSAAGQMGSSPTSKTTLGGIYTLFHNSSAQSLWANQSVSVNTATNAVPGGKLVDSYLVSYEDWRLNSGSDADYSDLRIALQFFNPDGSAYDVNIPEPATWAVLVSLAAFAYVVARRLRFLGKKGEEISSSRKFITTDLT